MNVNKNKISSAVLMALVFFAGVQDAIVLLFNVIPHPKRVCEVFLDMIWYVYFSASYTHTFVVYAFCNIDDVSWGTKGQVFEFMTVNIIQRLDCKVRRNIIRRR